MGLFTPQLDSTEKEEEGKEASGIRGKSFVSEGRQMKGVGA